MQHNNAVPSNTLQHPPAQIAKLQQWIGVYTDPAITKKGAKYKIKSPVYRKMPKTLKVCDPTPDLNSPGHPSVQGFAHNAIYPFITIDIDIDPSGQKKAQDIPDSIRSLLASHPTYTEESQSRVGLHILYQLDAQSHKFIKNLPGRYDITDPTSNLPCGEIFSRNNNYVYYTFYPSTLTPPNTPVATVTLQDLALYIPELALEKIAVYIEPTSASTPASTSNIQDAEVDILAVINKLDADGAELTKSIPLTGTPLASKIAKRLKLPMSSGYDWWLSITMSFHDLATRLDEVNSRRAYHLADLWCQQHDDYDPKELENEWLRFTAKPTKESNISYKLLLQVAKLTAPDWVVTQNDIPVPVDIRNLKPLLAHENIKLLFNVVKKNHWFSSDTTELREIEATLLASLMQNLMSKYNMPKVSLSHGKAYASSMPLYKEDFNPVKDWIASVPWDKVDRVKPLLKTLHTPSKHKKFRQLYEAFIYKNLMTLVANQFYVGPDGGTKGIVIIQGEQFAYKSTWVTGLMPLQEYYCASSKDPGRSSEFSKDFNIEAGAYALVNYDECERIFNKIDTATLKNFLAQETDTFRDLYGKQTKQHKRYSSFWGTTNEVEIKGDDTGMRRFWFIPDVTCDTNAQRRIDMQQVYAQIKVEMEYLLARKSQYHMPWDLSHDEQRLNKENLTGRLTTTGLDIEVEDFEAEFMFDFRDRCHEFTTKTGEGPDTKVCVAQRALKAKYVSEGIGVKNAKHLKHVLERFCARWINPTGQRELVVPGMSGYFTSRGLWIPNPTNNKMARYYLVPSSLPKIKQEGDLT